jgi:predicted nuclease with TOPRIM domain
MIFSLFRFLSLAMNENNSEFIAIELEISEIDEQINRLRQKRFHLVKRQKELKETIKQNQQSTTRNVNDQWKRTGSSK